MQPVDQLTTETQRVIDKMLTPPKDVTSSLLTQVIASLERHASVVGMLEQVLYDVFKQLPVAEVQKVLDKMKKV